MASDKLFFPKIAEVHHKFHTPANAIVAQSVWAIVLILFWGTFENLISYVEFVDWIFFGLTGTSIFIFRKKILMHNVQPKLLHILLHRYFLLEWQSGLLPILLLTNQNKLGPD
jgi:amino acid transporter